MSLAVQVHAGIAHASALNEVAAVSTTDPQSTDSLDPQILATMRHQEALQPALRAIWDEQRRNPKSGFAGVAFEGDGLSLYWKGGLTPGMTNALAQARRVGPVAVKAAAFSEGELQAEVQKIDHMIKKLEATDIQTFGAEPDGSGVHIRGLSDSIREAVSAARVKDGKAPIVPARDLVAQARVNVPVTFETATGPVRQNSARHSDSSPYNGGGSWRNKTKSKTCSTGFGVHTIPSWHSYVLTAAHCASPGDYVVSWNLEHTMGPVTNDLRSYDIMLIDTPGYNIIFDGNANTSTTKKVNSWNYWAANELVCQSGEASGTQCNIRQIRVTNIVMGKADSDGVSGYTVYGMVEGYKGDGIPAIDGDSGGPVFTLDGAGVCAKGITSATIVSGQTGYLYFQDWGTIIDRFAAYPNFNNAWSLRVTSWSRRPSTSSHRFAATPGSRTAQPLAPRARPGDLQTPDAQDNDLPGFPRAAPPFCRLHGRPSPSALTPRVGRASAETTAAG